jgi:hypothetical protein
MKGDFHATSRTFLLGRPMIMNFTMLDHASSWISDARGMLQNHLVAVRHLYTQFNHWVALRCRAVSLLFFVLVRHVCVVGGADAFIYLSMWYIGKWSTYTYEYNHSSLPLYVYYVYFIYETDGKLFEERISDESSFSSMSISSLMNVSPSINNDIKLMH